MSLSDENIQNISNDINKNKTLWKTYTVRTDISRPKPLYKREMLDKMCKTEGSGVCQGYISMWF